MDCITARYMARFRSGVMAGMIESAPVAKPAPPMPAIDLEMMNMLRLLDTAQRRDPSSKTATQIMYVHGIEVSICLVQRIKYMTHLEREIGKHLPTQGL